MLENVDERDQIEGGGGKRKGLQSPEVKLDSRSPGSPFGSASRKLDSMQVEMADLLHIAQQPAVTAAHIKDSGTGIQATREMPGAGFREVITKSFDV